MKKQINPNTKAHLIRSAFYVILFAGRVRDSVRTGAAKHNQAQRGNQAESCCDKNCCDKAQLAAQLERAKAVPSSLIGKKQLAQHKTASDQAQLRL